jgi:ABC-type Fe3+-hydroxamate transport system substrate-binding protein
VCVCVCVVLVRETKDQGEEEAERRTIEEAEGTIEIDDDVKAIVCVWRVITEELVVAGDVREVDVAVQEWCVLIKLWSGCPEGQRR